MDISQPKSNEQHRNLITLQLVTKVKSMGLEQKTNAEREKLQIKEEMLNVQSLAFRAQMNPHFIFNALNAIQFFITSEKKREALNYLSVFSKLIRFHLHQIDKETVSLKDEIKMLGNYLKLQKLRYGNKLNYIIHQIEDDTSGNAIIPSFLLQTLFENIIEHAIYNQFNNHSIEVTFTTAGEHVTVMIIFTYISQKTSRFKYVPDYRKQFIRWKNQIQILNHLKNYKIKKNVTFTETPQSNGGKISIRLPNLV